MLSSSPSGCPTARSPAVRKGWNGRRLVPSRASRVRVQGLASVAAYSYYCRQLLFAVYSGVELSVSTQLWWLQDVPFLSVAGAGNTSHACKPPGYYSGIDGRWEGNERANGYGEFVYFPQSSKVKMVRYASHVLHWPRASKYSTRCCPRPARRTRHRRVWGEEASGLDRQFLIR